MRVVHCSSCVRFRSDRGSQRVQVGNSDSGVQPEESVSGVLPKGPESCFKVWGLPRWHSDVVTTL